MDAPSPDELAAIAAAYLAVAARAEPLAARGASRWRLAARLAWAEPALRRAAARSGSRWTMAGRLDG